MIDIGCVRLRNQSVSNNRLKDAAAVVQRLGAVQAQDYLGALWAVGLRMRAAEEADIEEALANGAIVRTWPMRGTLHFVPAEDTRWMLDLMARRVISASAGRYRQLELDDRVFARCERILVEALTGGKHIVRPAFYKLLEGAGISSAESRGLHILGNLAMRGVICFAARAGKQQAFALLDEWVPNPRVLTTEEALAELTRRYFSSHGPATVQDFAWWSGLTLREIRVGLTSVERDLVQQKIEGRTYWSAPHRRAAADSDTAYLLPPFDEFTVAYKDRSAVIDPEYARLAGSGGMLNPTIVVGGRVLGAWRRTLDKDAVKITLQPFQPLTRKQKDAIAAAAERYGTFLGRVPRVR
jgi:hypothetical protein